MGREFTAYRAALTGRIKRRFDRCSPAVQAIAWKAQIRLCPRFRRMLNQGRPRNLVVTAIAREMCGFICPMLTDGFASSTTRRALDFDNGAPQESKSGT